MIKLDGHYPRDEAHQAQDQPRHLQKRITLLTSVLDLFSISWKTEDSVEITFHYLRTKSGIDFVSFLTHNLEDSVEEKPRGSGGAEVPGDEGSPHQTHPPTQKHQEAVNQDEVREDGDTLPRRCLIRRRGIPGQKPDVIQECTPIQEVKKSTALC